MAEPSTMGGVVEAVSPWLTLVVSVVGVPIAIYQIRKTQIHARARVLTSIMNGWDESYLTPGKNIFYPRGERHLAAFGDTGQRRGTQYLAFVETTRAAECAFVDLMRRTRRRTGYVPLLRVADFFQNVAMMAERGYIAGKDARALFGYHLRVFDLVAGGYIREQRRNALAGGLTDTAPVRYNEYTAFADKVHRDFAEAMDRRWLWMT